MKLPAIIFLIVAALTKPILGHVYARADSAIILAGGALWLHIIVFATAWLHDAIHRRLNADTLATARRNNPDHL